MQTKFIRTTALGLAALLASTTIGLAADLTGKEVRIGAIVPASGHFAEWGRANTVALKMLEQAINDEGGVNGAKLSIVIYDDAAKPAQAASMVRKLADDDQVLAIAGPATSSAVEVAFPVANQLGIVAVSQNSSKPGVAAANRPWAFRNTVDEAKLARVTVPWFAKEYGVAKVAMIYDVKDATAASGGKSIFPEVLKESGVELLNADDPITFNTGDMDVSAQVTKLKALNPEAVVVSADYSQAVTVIREMKRQGLLVPVVGSTQLISTAILQAAPEIPVIAPTTFFAGLDVPKVKAFVDELTPLQREERNLPKTIVPSQFDANIYEIVSLFISAIQHADVTADDDTLAADREKIRDYMASETDFEGLGGTVKFAPDGDAIKTFFIVEGKDGAWATKMSACSSPEPGACEG